MLRRTLLFILFSIVLIIPGPIDRSIISAHEYVRVSGYSDLEEPHGSMGSESAGEAVLKGEDIRIAVSFAGDCTIGTDESFPYVNSFPQMLKRQNNDYSYFFSGVKHIFEEDALTLVNLETALTKAVNKAEKTYRFRGSPDYVNILKSGSVEMVNISNNHIYDYLQEGFDETLDTLDAAGILYSGRGHIAYLNVGSKTIASIGYDGWETSIGEELKTDIEKARRNADIVIVSFHWGVENSYYPGVVQLELGHLGIDAGADIVVGHHPHVVQGIELYKGRYIVYSLGNFCFGGNSNPYDKDTVIFRGEFTFKGSKLQDCTGTIIPCSISSAGNVNDYRPVVLDGNEGRRVLDRVYKYSSALEFGIRQGE